MKAHYARIFLLLSAVSLTGFAGDRPGSGYKEINVKEGGAISGRVRLEGQVPANLAESITKDTDYCGRKKSCPRLVLGKNAGVKDAIVRLDRIAEGKKFSSLRAGVVRQRGCEYEPHIVILPAGTPLEIVNDDPILHNVHAYELSASMRSVLNIAQPLKGQKTRVGAAQLECGGEIMATCDAGHPWMRAYIVHAPHPYYAVTDAEGKFQLTDVPPGTYTVTMWHEGVFVKSNRVGAGAPPVIEEPYMVSRQITVGPKGTVVADFSLELRSRGVTQ
jgi:plastocyanin